MDANECGTPRCARCEVQDGTQFILRENGMRLMGSTAFFPQNSSIQDILFLQFFLFLRGMALVYAQSWKHHSNVNGENRMARALMET
jgi:hypothetical protein